MQPLVERSPPAAAFYYGTFGMWVITDMRINIRNRGGSGENLDRGSRFWVVLFIGAGLSAALVLARASVANIPGWFPVIVGIAIAVAGIALRQWSVATLGSFFTTSVEVQADHRIVARGPYAVLRPPRTRAFCSSWPASLWLWEAGSPVWSRPCSRPLDWRAGSPSRRARWPRTWDRTGPRSQERGNDSYRWCGDGRRDR